MPQEYLIDRNLQLHQATPDVIIILPVIQLIVVVPEDLARGQIWGVSITNRVLETSGTRLVKENSE